MATSHMATSHMKGQRGAPMISGSLSLADISTIAVSVHGEGKVADEARACLAGDRNLDIVSMPRAGYERGYRRARRRSLVVVLASTQTGPSLTQAVTAARPEGSKLVAVLPPGRSSADPRRAMRAGADGVVLNDELAGSLIATVHAVASGQLVMPRQLMERVAPEPLTHREKEIVGMVVAGATNRQIADTLYLAESTVKTHVSSIFGKVGTRSRAELAQLVLDPEEGLAAQLQLVEPSVPAG